MDSTANTLKNNSRIAGLWFLLWILTGAYGMSFVPSRIDTSGDAATTAQNILSHEFLFRTGILNDLISGTIWIIMVMALYRLFNNVNNHLAKLLVAFVIVQVPAIIFIEAFNLTSLMLLKGEILTSFDQLQRQDLASFFIKVNEYLVSALILFWGLWLFPLAILVWQSRFLPRFLGAWLMINGLAYVALSVTGLLYPAYRDIAYKIAFPAMLGEVAFMLWLLIRGARPFAAPEENT